MGRLRRRATIARKGIVLILETGRDYALEGGARCAGARRRSRRPSRLALCRIRIDIRVKEDDL
jgi:hypothetical protein